MTPIATTLTAKRVLELANKACRSLPDGGDLTATVAGSLAVTGIKNFPPAVDSAARRS
jgi:hypothetical protein